MAYAFNFEDEEQNQQSDGQTQLGPESAIITGQEAKPQAGQTGSGQYTNLQSYLDQPGTREFGEQFTGKIGETVTGAFGAQDKAKSDFQTAAQQGSVAKNENIIKEASETPEMVVADPYKKSEFIAQRDAQYKGPEQFSGTEQYYSPAYQATQKAKDYTELAQKEGGQRVLLDEFYGRPGYTGGQKTLDSILIGMNPGTRQSLQAQQQKAQEAYTNFGQLEGSLNEFAKQRKSDTEATKNAATSALSSSNAAYQKSIQDKASQAISSRDALTQKINQAVKSRDVSNLSDSELALVGLDRTKPLFGYQGDVAQANNAINLNSVTSPEEYARMQAYQDLGGLQNIITDEGQLGSQVGKPGVTRNADTDAWLGNKQAGFQDEVDRLIFSLGAYNNGQNPITYGTKGQQMGDMQGYLFSPQLDSLIASSNNPEYRAAIQKLISDKRNEVMARYGANDYFSGYGPLLSQMGPTIRPKNYRT